MKVKLIGTNDSGALIHIPYTVLTALDWRAGDRVTIDIPMTGGKTLTVAKETV